MPLTLLLADASPVSRRAVRDLAQASSRYRVVAEAATAEEMLTLFEDHGPDVVVMAAGLAGGAPAVRRLTERDGGARVLLTAGPGEEALVMEGLVAGALEFTSRPYDAARTLALLDRVANRPGDDGSWS